MSSDFTQQQTLGELREAERLSMQATLPPAEVPGVRIERLIGQGAFGQVWMGRDLNTGREVAIKFYLHRGGVNWSLLGREVKHLVNMSTGRFIVQVLTVGWEAEPPYYVMEYLENGSLEDLIRKRGRLGINEAVALFREIAEGLNYAHGKGVLHCDLKPANILLDHDWRPRLADFGQSRMSHEQSPSLGTLFYMAPEQADLAASADASWDVYALGAILYTMLVGTPPYRVPEIVETLDSADSLPARLERYRTAIHQSPFPKQHQRRRGIDKPLVQIVDRCLAKRPEQRFGNVQQVLEAIACREHARFRKPLYLLGIVGPLLLLFMMMLFFFRGISVAKRESLGRVEQWTLRSNEFAAKFAARTLESEIATLFRLVSDEAARPSLIELTNTTIQEHAAFLAAAAAGTEQPSDTAAFVDSPTRRQLEQKIQQRLQALTALAPDSEKGAIFSSLFVLDAHGNHLAIAYVESEELRDQSPVGHNFAYRSYFTGLREDMPRPAANQPPKLYPPTRHPHFSGSFRSTSTGMWKVGISCPIWDHAFNADTPLSQPAEATADAPLGVLVLTINLGDFQLLAGEKEETDRNRLAVLVDGRPGNLQGTLLQHPLLTALTSEPTATRQEALLPLVDPRQLDQLLAGGGLRDYVDPASKHPQGGAYQGPWIAAVQQVALPSIWQGQGGTGTDLWVLVQERASRAQEPVNQLGNRLQRESLLALGTVVLVICVLWYFVFRLSEVRDFSPPGASTNNTLNYSVLKSTIDHD
jgi:eukaryotic-like serine/threonine-protein kinase